MESNNKLVPYPEPERQHRRSTQPPTISYADFTPVSDRYTNLQFRALGGYGIVVSALDTQQAPCTANSEEHDVTPSNKIAIKKITLIDNAKYHVLLLREIRILGRLEHENIIDIRDMMIAPRPTVGEAEYQIDPPIERSIFIFQTLMDFDLHAAIRQQMGGLSGEHICCFVYQILRGLKYIHSARVVHRDLKPTNILLNANCELKICDFGQARIVDPANPDTQSRALTEYVVTRWYRAPEIMLSPRAYTQAVDIWAVGCIFAEMLCSRPLFPGTTSTDQITKIVNILGTPPQDQLNAVTTCPSAREFINQLPPVEKQSWQRVIGVHNGIIDEHTTDLLDKLLTFDPAARVSAEDALEHPYLHVWHLEDDEPVCEEVITFEPNIDGLSVQQLERLLMVEIDSFQQRRAARQ